MAAPNFMNALIQGQQAGLRAQEAQRQNKLRRALQAGDLEAAMAIDPQTTTQIIATRTAQHQEQRLQQQQAQEQQRKQAKNIAGQTLQFIRMVKGADSDAEKRIILERMGPAVAQSMGMNPEEMSLEEFEEQAKFAEPQLKSLLFEDLPADVRADILGVGEEDETRTLSPDEVRQLGLPEGTVAQRAPDGSIDIIRDPTRGQGVTVNVGGEQETARQKEAGKVVGRVQAEDFESIVKRGRQARDLNTELDQLQSLQDSIEGTGPLKGAITNVKAFVQGTLGVDPEAIGITDDTAASEAFRSIGNRLALRMRNPESGLGLTGNTSDRDLQFLKQSVPSIENTEGGNRIILGMWERVLDRRQKEAQIAREFVREHGPSGVNEKGQSLQDKLDEFNEKNPMFEEDFKESVLKAAQGGAGTNLEQTIREAEQFLNRGGNGNAR